jgi:hypothetical protein
VIAGARRPRPRVRRAALTVGVRLLPSGTSTFTDTLTVVGHLSITTFK